METIDINDIPSIAAIFFDEVLDHKSSTHNGLVDRIREISNQLKRQAACLDNIARTLEEKNV